MPLKKLLFLLSVFLLFSCQKTKQPVAKDKWIDYRKAYALLLRQNDSAFYYFNKIVSNSDDSLQIAMSYYNMAVIQSNAGDYYGAEESVTTSLKFLNEKITKNYDCLARDYNELGMNCANLRNYNIAIDYYDRALKFIDSNNLKLAILNNKANAYQEEGAYSAALKIYQSLINKASSKQTYARILTNIARTKWLHSPDYNAAPELLKALYIRQKEKDIWGQNSSYAHLADFYAFSHPDSALYFARAMYTITKQLNSPDDKLQALQKLIKFESFKDIKQYFVTYQNLSDSLQTARNAAKNQFAVIRYNVEKSKADNLRLQKDNSESKYQLIKQKLLLYSILFVFITAGVFAIFWYKKRKQRLELEAQNVIRENQLKISKKIHDVVANGLYRMMAEIENQESINKDRLLDSIEDMYEKSRDISYDKVQHYAHFHEKISQLLTSFATDNIKVLLIGNSTELWEKAGPHVRYEVEHILQELMVNMKKHSSANNVVIRFEEKNDHINILYTDNGIGMPEKIIYKNGLTNTGNRINLLNGIITFDTHQQKGLKIFISFPVT